MSDVKQEHPEFFKAASERDTANETVDELLEDVVVPIFVEVDAQAGRRNNRRAAGLIALLGGVIFAIFYAAAAGGLIAVRQGSDSALASTLSFLTTPIYWLTIALFTGLFALLALVLNSASWPSFVVGSFFVAFLTYVAAVGAGLIAIHAWELTFERAQSALWEGIAFSPLILVAPVLGREIPLWLGIWISRRAKRLREATPFTVAESQ